MGEREKVGVFKYKSGNSQGILIHELGMNPEREKGKVDKEI